MCALLAHLFEQSPRRQTGRLSHWIKVNRHAALPIDEYGDFDPQWIVDAKNLAVRLREIPATAPSGEPREEAEDPAGRVAHGLVATYTTIRVLPRAGFSLRTTKPAASSLFA